MFIEYEWFSMTLSQAFIITSCWSLTWMLIQAAFYLSFQVYMALGISNFQPGLHLYLSVFSVPTHTEKSADKSWYYMKIIMLVLAIAWLQGDKRPIFSAGSLPLGWITFYNQTMALDRSWHVLGLGYDSGIGRAEIEKAAVIHYDGVMKPWLDIAIPRYKGYWTQCIRLDHPLLQRCNIQLWSNNAKIQTTQVSDIKFDQPGSIIGYSTCSRDCSWFPFDSF